MCVLFVIVSLNNVLVKKFYDQSTVVFIMCVCVCVVCVVCVCVCVWELRGGGGWYAIQWRLRDEQRNIPLKPVSNLIIQYKKYMYNQINYAVSYEVYWNITIYYKILF